ncbi:MAG: STAS domain-containing protein [Acidobacteria bacterium]|nr:STAS domain-containing protein [Acidobacteriota bacterium]
MSEILQIQTDRIEPDITVLAFAGKIVLGPDSLGIETLVADLVRKNEKKVIFDLSRVYYIDSSGLGVIANCFSKLQHAGGELHMAGAGDKVRALFRITRLDAMMPFYPTVIEASRDFTVGRKPGGADRG